MWGTPYGLQLAQGMSRFIPTHVGNTGAITAAAQHRAVNPHACGEHNMDYTRFT